MRSIMVVIGFALLSACGGPETSQANNSQANIANEAQPPATAEPTNLQVRASAGDAVRIMHERHEGMEAIGKAFKALHRELDASSPNLGVVRPAAAQIARLGGKASGWFPAGTGPEAGKTGAKPEIWQTPRDFAAKLAAFQRSSRNFNTIAAGNDVDGIKAAYADLGGTCKACHDRYRTEMHH